MAEITVRPLEERDAEGFLRVASLTYNNGEPCPADWIKSPNKRYVGELNGEIGGIFSVLDLNSSRNGPLLRNAGVAGVAVMPNLRRTGMGSALMTWSVRHFRDQGIPIASLYAFREQYYRRFGYELCGMRYKVNVPNARIPSVQSDLPVTVLTHADWPRLAECQRAFAESRSGSNARTEYTWSRVLDEKKTIYAVGDPVEGYAVVQHNWEFWVEQHINEVTWSTHRGYEGVLQVLAGIGINKTGLDWWEPADSPLLAKYTDQGIRFTSDRPVMYRVCDVPGALQQLTTEESGEFTVGIRDELLTENTGTWRVRFSPAGVEVERSGTAGLEMDIRQFTQGFLGQPSFADLARNGLIEVNDPQALRTALRLMPPSPVYCNEFF